jgi:hypothetical protein
MTALSVRRTSAEKQEMGAEERRRTPPFRLLFKSTFGMGAAALIVFGFSAPYLNVEADVVSGGVVTAFGAVLGALLALRA